MPREIRRYDQSAEASPPLQQYYEPVSTHSIFQSTSIVVWLLGLVVVILAVVGAIIDWPQVQQFGVFIVLVLLVMAALALVVGLPGVLVYRAIHKHKLDTIKLAHADADFRAKDNEIAAKQKREEAEAKRIEAEAYYTRAEAEKLLSTVEWDGQGNAARWDPLTGRIVQVQGQMREHPALHSLNHHWEYKDTSTKVSEEPGQQNLLTSGGQLHIPTFAENLASGDIGPGQRDVLFCYELIADEITRQMSISPIRGAINEQHTQLIVAGSQSGKSTYMASNMAQAAALGTLFYIVDPHKNHPEKSIAAKVACLKDWFILPPACTHDEIRQFLKHATKVRDARIAGKPTPYDGYNIMVVVDEVPSLMANQRSSDKALRQLYIDLALFMQSLGIGTAKFGITGLYASQFATKEALGEIDFRDACMSQLIMRLHPTQAQAMRVLGTDAVREIPKFAKGHGYLLLSDSTEVRRVASGNVEIPALEQLARMLPASPLVKMDPKAGRKQVENRSIIPIREDIEASDFASESGLKADNNQVGNQIEPALQAKLTEMGISEAYILLKVDRVSDLLGQNKGDVIRAVWGAAPGKSKAYQDAEEEYNLVMAIIRYQHSQVRAGRRA